MLKYKLDNDALNAIIAIEQNKFLIESKEIPISLSNRLRKNTKKMSAYSSNKIEGNPLSLNEAMNAIDIKNRHLLKPEQEILNYYNAIEYLENEINKKTILSLDFILKVQSIIVKGESKEKIGIRGQTPPGFLFAVYDSVSNKAEYIPPEYKDVIPLLEELIEYVNTSNDHPLIKSAIFHYQLVTIHPFEDGNGRTARILANYILSLYGYSFKNIGSLEEFISYDLDEYYASLQMGLPPLYYDGRNNPPHIEIWINYYLKIIKLYTNKIVETIKLSNEDYYIDSYNHLSSKAKTFLHYLNDNRITYFTPNELAIKLNVTNRTIINWAVELSNNGFLKPNIVKQRITSYSLINLK